MNSKLRNTLSALVVAASFLSLSYALGEPPRPSTVAAHLGHSAAVALATNKASAERQTRLSGQGRAQLSMPYFSFGPQRANVGAR
jgi:hypothetical protein